MTHRHVTRQAQGHGAEPYAALMYGKDGEAQSVVTCQSRTLVPDDQAALPTRQSVASEFGSEHAESEGDICAGQSVKGAPAIDWCTGMNVSVVRKAPSAAPKISAKVVAVWQVS